MGWPAALKCSAAGLRRNGARVEDPIPRSIAHFDGEGSTAYSTAPRGLIRSETGALLAPGLVIGIGDAAHARCDALGGEPSLLGVTVPRLDLRGGEHVIPCVGHCRPFLLFQYGRWTDGTRTRNLSSFRTSALPIAPQPTWREYCLSSLRQ
jgi:hypothetical protein